MMKDSVIRRSAQTWKLFLGVTLLLAGSFLPLADRIGMSWTVGTIIAGLGYAFALAFVRCPACKSRWLWQATLNAELYAPLFRQPECPECGQRFDAI